MSPEEIRTMFGDYDGASKSTKWIPSEWAYGNNSLNNSVINTVNVSLCKARETLVGDESDFRKRIQEIMISSLLELKKIYDTKNEDVTYFISMSDDVSMKKVERESAKILNSKDVFNSFIKDFTS